MHTKILGFLILTGGTVFSGEIILPSGALGSAQNCLTQPARRDRVLSRGYYLF
jgi:hypothetical protein